MTAEQAISEQKTELLYDHLVVHDKYSTKKHLRDQRTLAQEKNQVPENDLMCPNCDLSCSTREELIFHSSLCFSDHPKNQEHIAKKQRVDSKQELLKDALESEHVHSIDVALGAQGEPIERVLFQQGIQRLSLPSLVASPSIGRRHSLPLISQKGVSSVSCQTLPISNLQEALDAFLAERDQYLEKVKSLGACAICHAALGDDPEQWRFHYDDHHTTWMIARFPDGELYELTDPQCPRCHEQHQQLRFTVEHCHLGCQKSERDIYTTQINSQPQTKKQCTLCPHIFEDLDRLLEKRLAEIGNHYDEHHLNALTIRFLDGFSTEIQKPQCPRCLKAFKNLKAVAEHAMSCQPYETPEPLEIEQGSKKPTPPKAVMVTSTGKVKCPTCNTIVRDSTSFKYHWDAYHSGSLTVRFQDGRTAEVSTPECPRCLKPFKNLRSVQDHTRRYCPVSYEEGILNSRNRDHTKEQVPEKEDPSLEAAAVLSFFAQNEHVMEVVEEKEIDPKEITTKEQYIALFKKQPKLRVCPICNANMSSNADPRYHYDAYHAKSLAITFADGQSVEITKPECPRCKKTFKNLTSTKFHAKNNCVKPRQRQQQQNFDPSSVSPLFMVLEAARLQQGYPKGW
ncbi:hypothetical protein EDD86DRAFT_208851 [Gorgonomyces haynaldii]|nr:hypothetical protein EDD86DRAFT_208851 [Gorgonomyces haynaldii]